MMQAMQSRRARGFAENVRSSERKRANDVDVPRNMYLTRWEVAKQSNFRQGDQGTSSKLGGNHFLRDAGCRELATPEGVKGIQLIVIVFSLHWRSAFT